MPASTPQQEMLALVDEAPMRPIQYWLWLLSCGGTLLDGFSIFALGVAMPLVVNDMGIGPGTVGLIGAGIVFGAVAGAAIGGQAGDRFGRKRLMLADMLFIALGAALSAVARGPMLLFVGQLIIGVGIGIDFAAGGAYVSEWMPKASRSRMMVATIACQSVGMLLAAALTILVLKETANPQAWHGFLAIVGAIALLFFVPRLWMPESARWYIGENRISDAAAAIGRVLPGKRVEAESLAGSYRATRQHVAPIETSQKPRPGIGMLFQRDYISRTVLVSVPWFLMDIATYGIGLFTPVILGAIHLSGHPGKPVVADLYDARGSALIDLFLLAGFLLSLWAVPKFGRIRMQMIGFGGMAAGMLILLVSTKLVGGAPQHVSLVFIGFTLFNLLMNAGPNATTFTLPPELFPTRLRASAGGFAAGFAKLGATLGVFVLPIIKSSFGVPAVLGLMACVSVAGLLVTVIFGRPIAEGGALES
jgi:putative MFS transporter